MRSHQISETRTSHSLDGARLENNGVLRRSTLALAVGSFLLAVGVPLFASSVPRVSAQDRIRQADFIFEGTVTQINHRNAEPSGVNQVRIPHTFVTFQIQRIFKGSSAAGNTITLRFRGGPDGMGRTLSISGIPQFQLGDREILFVRRNGVDFCPIVGWEQGRLRVVRGNVFDEHGRELWIAPSGDFLFGEKTINVRAAAYPRVQRATTPNEPRPLWVPPEGSLRPDASGFGALLNHAVILMAGRGEISMGVASPSLNRGESFVVEAPVPVSPPSMSKKADPELFRGKFDSREAEMARKILKSRIRSAH